MTSSIPLTSAHRRALAAVGVLNVLYGLVEFGAGGRIGAVSPMIDAVDFLEDAAMAFLVLAAVGWPARVRWRVALGFVILMAIPAFTAAATFVGKLLVPAVPSPPAMSAIGAGAAAVNLSCALMLARHRRSGGTLARAAWLSARNDVMANVAIVAAAALTAIHPSPWPDMVVAAGIGLLHADAAREVLHAARADARDAGWREPNAEATQSNR